MAKTVSATLTAGGASGGRPGWLLPGILFGLLSATAIWLLAPIGVSTTYPRLVGAGLRLAAPAAAQANPMLKQIGGFLVPESTLVLGLLLGGFLASRLGRRAAPEPAHPGEGAAARRRNAFLGGILIIYGARLAGGCTSGHIISGITQLALSGFVFAAGVFAAGIGTAKLLAKGGRS